MGVFTYENENISTVAAARLYKALAFDCDELLPKAVKSIQSLEIVEGNQGPGTLKKITYTEDGETRYVLHKFEEIDEANLAYKYSIVGGDGLPDLYEKISFETKVEANPNGGSIARLTVKYITKGDAQPIEEQVGSKAKGNLLFEAIEGYVVANPDYN